jgi:hypothetical protein
MSAKGSYQRLKSKEADYEKICNVCNIKKNKNDFEINQIAGDDRLVRRGTCKQCRSYKKSIPPKVKKDWESKKPKIGEEFFCPICKCTKIVQHKTSVCIDHNHITGNVRGLICLACNSGIGQLQDSVEILRNAIEWIQRNELEVSPKEKEES